MFSALAPQSVVRGVLSYQGIDMILKHSKSALMLCTAISTFVFAQSAAAQNAQPANGAAATTQLQEIVVKGKRNAAASAASDTPLATQTSADVIQKKQINSISDLGRTTEVGVNFNRSTGAVNIRGLEGSRVLTTVDGIPLPYLSDDTRSVNGGVDTIGFSSLSAVDVVRGGDSSRAGAGALGGVLSFRTLEAEDLLSDGRDWGALTKAEYDSVDHSIGTSLAAGKKIDNTSILFQAGYKKGHERSNQGRVDGYGSTRTMQDPADTKKYDLLFKLRHDLAGGHRIGLTAERFYAKTKIDAFTQQNTANFNIGNYDSFENANRSRLSLDYKFVAEGSDSPVDKFDASLYWMRQSLAAGYDAYRNTRPFREIGRSNVNDQTTLGIVANGEKAFDLGSAQHTVTFGFDVAKLGTKQFSGGYDTCNEPFSGTRDTCGNLHTNMADTPKVGGYKVGAYIDDHIALGSSGFSVTPGLRLDWADYDPEMTPEFERNNTKPKLPNGFDDFAISPKLRGEYQFTDSLTGYAQWSSAFRAPTMSELYSTFGAPNTYLRLGNSQLESETGNSFDLGFNLNTGDIKAKMSVFYNRFSNFIDSKTLNADEMRAIGLNPSDYTGTGKFVSQKYNIASVQTWGTEFAATKAFDNGLSFTAGFAYTNGKDRDTGAFLRSVAPMKLVLGANYDAEQWGIGANWVGVRQGKGISGSDSSGTSHFKTPGYGIVDLSAWWEPEQAKGLRLQAGIYNVFDKTYYDSSSARSKSTPYERYTEPGRSFKISLTQKF
jgi:hemoglobin/transferrin/lactoferrin receptor protein